MSEVNLLKSHEISISTHFSSKIEHDKIKLETTQVLGCCSQSVAVDLDRFVLYFIRWETCKWRPPTVALWDLRETIRMQALLTLVNP